MIMLKTISVIIAMILLMFVVVWVYDQWQWSKKKRAWRKEIK